MFLCTVSGSEKMKWFLIDNRAKVEGFVNYEKRENDIFVDRE